MSKASRKLFDDDNDRSRTRRVNKNSKVEPQYASDDELITTPPPSPSANARQAPPPAPMKALSSSVAAPRSWRNEWRLAKEKWYTWFVLLPAVIVMHNTAHNAVFWRWNKEEMYARDPLPDLFLNYEQDVKSAEQMFADTMRFVLFVFIVAVAVFSTCLRRRGRHQSPVLVLHRFVLVYSASSVLRCVTFFLTLLPGTASYCLAPELGGTYTPARAPQDWREIFTRYDWTHACGDLLYSGHTILVVCAHMVNEHMLQVREPPHDWFYGWECHPLLQFSRLALPFFLAFTVRARKHYSIDVFIAFCVTVFLWKLIDPVRVEQERRERALRYAKREKDESLALQGLTSVDALAHVEILESDDDEPAFVTDLEPGVVASTPKSTTDTESGDESSHVSVSLRRDGK